MGDLRIEMLAETASNAAAGKLEANNVLSLPPINHLGLAAELVKSFGGRPQYLQALNTLERELYAAAAH